MQALLHRNTRLPMTQLHTQVRIEAAMAGLGCLAQRRRNVYNSVVWPRPSRWLWSSALTQIMESYILASLYRSPCSDLRRQSEHTPALSITRTYSTYLKRDNGEHARCVYATK